MPEHFWPAFDAEKLHLAVAEAEMHRIGVQLDRRPAVTAGEKAGLDARLVNHLDTVCQRNAWTLGGVQAIILPPKSALPKADARGACLRVVKTAKQPVTFVIVFVGRYRDIGGGKVFRRDNFSDPTGHQSAASWLSKRHHNLFRFGCGFSEGSQKARGLGDRR